MDIANTNLKCEYIEEKLTITDGSNSIFVDFSKEKHRLKENELNRELVVRAHRIKGIENPIVLDATAGLGEDSFLLAAAGCKVLLYEKNETIANLLSDGLKRAKEDEALSNIAARMRLFIEDSILAMKNLDTPVDVIFLDPMFPKRTKSALVKKKFQLLQQLEIPCENESELLEAAILARPKRIVIKRPAKGPYLAGKAPSYSLNGKSIRYDCIVL